MTDSISHTAMMSVMRKQRIQDFLFHKVTMLFAFSVLVVLVGIIISLILESIPAFKTFGLHFIVSAEWDPVNDQYGALIPIIGTLDPDPRLRRGTDRPGWQKQLADHRRVVHPDA